jgi:Skp1 family, tetramerisation domain
MSEKYPARNFWGWRIAGTMPFIWPLVIDFHTWLIVDLSKSKIMVLRYTTSTATAQSNGTPSPFVTLISSDGFEFHVRRSAACVSGTIRRMLDTQSMIAQTFPPFFML